ncbi:hypothetical protein [Streptomyces boncukensis]|uniref:CBM6 domain-containing protein n=1 Tax=Streptomyces boncukensis TaxID=2711219 RepID=A0A6G4X488_9ACTN|nr:hypothetical protein [Streptomyces boncukensis]NGO71554.1 hypothetical protein [Streptomyces boncukensis]
MTAENNGTGTPPPEGDDDPFAYLYRQEGGAGGSAQQPGVPRRSYAQVRAVGERQYGAQAGPSPQAAPGQQPGSGPGLPPHQPNAHYAAPETMPGGRAAARRQAAAAGGGPGGPRKNRNGLLIGAIAVVAAVIVGIGAAIVFNDDSGKQSQGQSDNNDVPGQDEDKNPKNPKDGDKKPAKDKPKPTGLPSRTDAADATLAGGATKQTEVAKAQSAGGAYVGGMDKPGASVTWTLKDIPESGKYTVFVRYGVPGKDADSTLSVNGKQSDRPLNMSNFAGAKKGDWEAGWAETYSWIDLKEGTNRVQVACGDSNTCDFVLDQFWLKRGWVK